MGQLRRYKRAWYTALRLRTYCDQLSVALLTTLDLSPRALEGGGVRPRLPGVQSSAEMHPSTSVPWACRTLDSWGCSPGAGPMVWLWDALGGRNQDRRHREVKQELACDMVNRLQRQPDLCLDSVV